MASKKIKLLAKAALEKYFEEDAKSEYECELSDEYLGGNLDMLAMTKAFLKVLRDSPMNDEMVLAGRYAILRYGEFPEEMANSCAMRVFYVMVNSFLESLDNK